LPVKQFIASFQEAPSEWILDFDATDDRVHGNQEGRHFHGDYGDWCFLPLFVFCGEQLRVAYLRPSNIDPARHAWAILKLLVERLREAWPQVRIMVRADSGFCRWKMLLAAAAYVLMEAIRRLGLQGTELARAQVGTIRLKLLKIGTVIVRNTRRIRLFFSSGYPYQALFKDVCAALASG
jgi:hypothetical protein